MRPARSLRGSHRDACMTSGASPRGAGPSWMMSARRVIRPGPVTPDERGDASPEPSIRPVGRGGGRRRTRLVLGRERSIDGGMTNAFAGSPSEADGARENTSAATSWR